MRVLLSSLFLLSSLSLAQAQGLPVLKTFTYQSLKFDQGGTEINAFEPLSKRLFSTNGAESKIDIISLRDINKAGLVGRIDLSPYGGEVNSVAVYENTLAVAMNNNYPQAAGKIVFFDTLGNYINQLTVGAMPDMVTFSPSLQHILVANEGEPSDDYNADPIGSVSVINFVTGSAQNLNQSDVTNIDFTRYDTIAYDPLIRVFGNNGNASFSEDMEPEYICFNSNGSKAFVSLQENNALAIINIYPPELDTIVALGYKDHNQIGSGIDASDQKSSIDIKTHFNLFGLYQPDAIAWYEVGGNGYILSANEGDSRDYSAYSEEARINNVNLNPFTFNNSAQLQSDTVLGRLKVTTTLGNKSNGIQHDSLFAFGGRSFSIWDESGNLVWDSGDEFEQTLALLEPNNFNSNNDDNNSFKSRSDDKGPEPEAIAVGQVDGVWYAFIGLERMGGIMIYNIDDPNAPSFDSYILDRNFSQPANDTAAGDLGPEDISFIAADDSPNGIALLAVSNEVSGSLTVYQIGQGISLKEEALEEPVSVYPNPSHGVFNFSEARDVILYDAEGRKIGQYENSLQIDLSDQADGLYIIKDKSGHSLRIIKK